MGKEMEINGVAIEFWATEAGQGVNEIAQKGGRREGW